MATERAASRRRWPSTLWLVWALIAVPLTARQFLWQLALFKNPGPQFYKLVLAFVLMSPVILAVYQWIRRGTLWRYELVIMAAFLFAAALYYQPRAFLVTLWLLTACYAAGRFARLRLGLLLDSASEEIVISTGIGLATVLIVLFALGLLGGFHGWCFALLLTAPVVLFWRNTAELWASLRQCQAAWAGTPEISTLLGALLVAFAAALAVCAGMVILSPSLSYDALVLHLPAAQYYSAVHRLQPVPTNNYSYYPQAIESLMTLGLSLAGLPAAQMMPPLFFGLSLVLAFRIARHCGFGSLAAFGGVVVAATVPAIHWTGSIAKNDFAVAFFVLASFDCYMRANDGGNLRWLQLGTFFLAAADAVKDTALVALPASAVLYGFAAWRQPRRWRALASLLGIFLIFGVFWQLRTFVLVGNPLYPLGSPQAAVGAQDPPLRLALRLLRIPWDLQFHGINYLEGPLQVPAGIALLVFAPVWLLLRRLPLRGNERACLVFSIVYLLTWTWFPQRTMRYAAAPVLLLLLLTGSRALALQPKTALHKSLFTATLAYCFVFAITGTMILEINAPLLRLFSRRINSAEYLREAYYPYRSLEVVNARWQPGDWIFSGGNCAVAYGPDPACFECIPLPAGREAVEQIKVLLTRHPYRFLLVRTGTPEWSMTSLNAAPIYRDSQFTVYERNRP